MIDKCLKRLAKRRPIFHSEADFQFELATQIKHMHPKVRLRLEKPFLINSQNVHLDIFLIYRGQKVGIELKYKTTATKISYFGESFSLKEHSAGDLGCYDFWRDVKRLEELKKAKEIDVGFAVILTNYDFYWKGSPRNNNYRDFGLSHARQINPGTLDWVDNTKPYTIGRGAICISQKYKLNWDLYSKNLISNYNNQKITKYFKYLSIQI